MKAKKGCINEKCESRIKKIHYKDSDRFCSKCGNELQYVCSDCWTQLEDNKNRYCIICENKRKDLNEQRIEKVKKGAGAVTAVAASVGAAAAAVAKNVKNVDKAVKVVAKAGKEVAKRIIK